MENLKNAFKANIYLYRLNLSSWPQLEKMAAIMMKNYQCEEGWKILANEKIQQGCWKDATHIAKEHLIEEKANFKIALVKATLTPQQLEQSLKLIEAFKEAPYSELQPVVDKFMDLAIKINRLDLAEKAMTLFPESISTLFTKIPNFIEEKKENIALWVLDHCQKVLKNDPNAIHQAIKYYVHLGVAKKAIALAKSYYQTNLSE